MVARRTATPATAARWCRNCGVRMVDGALAKLCGFTECLDLASEAEPGNIRRLGSRAPIL